MAVTRAFGDHRWKWSDELIRTARDNFYGTSPRPNFKTPPYMTARPEVTTRKVQTEDFVILASDGLWDVISNDDAVTCVSRWLAAKKAGKPEPFKETKLKGGQCGCVSGQECAWGVEEGVVLGGVDDVFAHESECEG